LAWLAGIIDGEGSMGIYTTIDSIVINLNIANIDERIINRSAEICSMITGRSPGINIYYYKERKPRRAHYQLKLSSQKNILAVLREVKPYLIGKSDQAGIIIHVLENRKKYGKWTEKDKSFIGVLKDMKKTPGAITPSEAHEIMGTCNDHPVKGVGSSDPKRSVPLEGNDMICSEWQHSAVSKETGLN